ncbi:ERF family protein [Bartonella sp. LJL80]
MSNQPAITNINEEQKMAQNAVVEREDNQVVVDTVGINPFQLLDRAIMNGTAPDVISKLMDMQERWQSGQARMAFNDAIAKAMAQIPVVIKNKKVDFTSKNGGARTNYSYEDLSNISEAVKPILEEHGLSFRFKTENGNGVVKVTCIIAHKDGYFEENSLTAPIDASGNKNSIQSIGSTVTYLERYTLKAALGIAVAEDDDGKNAVAIDFLNDKQRDEITSLVHETGTNIAAFCHTYGATSVAEIPANMFHIGKQLLLAKKSKQAVEREQSNANSH